ncbi:MAG: PKD domain-containing protein, partial [Actinomycetota bacterium]|nr:PKD domain-containing protein [Actinomycetota bacterium]
TQIIGNSSDAPYINQLAAGGALMTNSFAETHPSQPNYIALFSGDTRGVTDDACLTAPLDAENLAHQLATAGKSFVGYSEDLPSVGYAGCSTANYVRKHNPWVNFPNVPASANQPFTSFPASDFTQLPSVSFVIPNLNNDMHDGTVAQGDAWLKSHLDAYVQWAKSHNSLLVLTWDEDDNNDNNQIPTVIIGQGVKTGSFNEKINHYNLLRTIQAGFGIPSLVNSTGAAPITSIWGTSTPPAHAAPVASFTSSAAALVLSVDGGGSTASDGASLSYAWDWGDGSAAGSGVTASHTYSAAGSFVVTLTVTDSLGATGTAVKTVPVSSQVFVAQDDFGRSVSSGWGSAVTGGAWSGTAGLSVSGGTGNMGLGAGATVITSLSGVSARDVDARLSIGTDKVANGTLQVNLAVRQTSAGMFRLKLRFLPTGSVRVNIAKVLNGTESWFTDTVVPGYTQSAGQVLQVRFRAVSSGSSTTLQAKVWPGGQAEPSGWTSTATDSDAALQTAGAVGVSAYLPGSTTNAPVTVSFDNLTVAPVEAPSHAAPVAAISAAVSGLSVAFDGTGSTASDGASISGYSWDFGDGASSTQAKPVHAYSKAGSYPVTLTVTDSMGAVSTAATKTVAVVTDAAPVASFTSSVSALALSVDASDSTASDGATLSYAWDFGDGGTGTGKTASHTYASAGPYTAKLTVTDSKGGTNSKTAQVAAAAAHAVPQPDHVVVVVMENHSSTQIIGN